MAAEVVIPGQKAPLAKGLFQRAIIQSAAPGAPCTEAQSDTIGNELLRRLKLLSGAEGLAALRALPAEKSTRLRKTCRSPLVSIEALRWSSSILIATYC